MIVKTKMKYTQFWRNGSCLKLRYGEPASDAKLFWGGVGPLKKIYEVRFPYWKSFSRYAPNIFISWKFYVNSIISDVWNVISLLYLNNSITRVWQRSCSTIPYFRKLIKIRTSVTHIMEVIFTIPKWVHKGHCIILDSSYFTRKLISCCDLPW